MDANYASFCFHVGEQYKKIMVDKYRTLTTPFTEQTASQKEHHFLEMTSKCINVINGFLSNIDQIDNLPAVCRPAILKTGLLPMLMIKSATNYNQSKENFIFSDNQSYGKKAYLSFGFTQDVVDGYFDFCACLNNMAGNDLTVYAILSLIRLVDLTGPILKFMVGLFSDEDVVKLLECKNFFTNALNWYCRDKSFTADEVLDCCSKMDFIEVEMAKFSKEFISAKKCKDPFDIFCADQKVETGRN